MSEEEAMLALQAARERLIATRMYMRHDYAWKDTEFREAEQRMTGVVCRLLYLYEMWRYAAATKHASIQIELLSDTPSASSSSSTARPKVAIVANGYTPFETQVASACAAMDVELIDPSTHVADDHAQAQIVFLYIAPPGEERVEDQYATFTAITDFHKAQQTPVDQWPLFCMLLGEAAFLEPPANDEVERLRGLSGFAISQRFSPLLQSAKYESLAQFAVEFTPHASSSNDHSQLGDLMGQFGCMEHNLMQCTEKWEFYGSSDSALVQDDELSHASEDEVKFWLQFTRGKACDECHVANMKLLRCSRCGDAFYCSRACQKTAWTLHKRLCGKTNEEITSS